MKTVLIAILVSNFSFLAYAGPSDAEILQSSVVTSVAKMLQDKHDGKCKTPTTSDDIQWMCMGNIMEVQRPIIDVTPDSCMFDVRVICPGETAVISGWRQAYYLHMPLRQRTKVKPTNSQIVFNGITFQ
ncbi:MAG: hypothetical protein ACJ76H_00930 [Bacteriovoracaceae bacterium]